MVRVDGDPAARGLDAPTTPLAKDPFDDAAAVQAMYDAGGILTHGRLPENIDAKASKNLGLADPRKLTSKGKVPRGGHRRSTASTTEIGGYSAFARLPRDAGCARRWSSPGESVTLHQPRRAPGHARRRAGLAQHHVV